MSSDSRPQIPPEYICPITHTVMVNAVMDDEGNSYSEPAIKEWLKKSSTSPITRKPLSLEKLVPNRMLRDLIDKFVRENNITPEQVAPPKVKTCASNSELEVRMARGTDNRILFKVTPPTADSPLPLNLVCTIDISSSMSTQVRLKDASGDVEDLGLNVLDLVKHSIKTIVMCLSARDTISFVTYNHCAKVELKPLLLTDANKKKAIGILDKIVPCGQTNLWGGLAQSLELCEGNKDKNNNIMLFTDGMPNVVPPRGHIPMLQKYISEHNGVPAVISTFGFGYSMDSPLLTQIATLGGGTYAFIPDGSLVGTIFVNAVSTMMCRFARDVTLTITETKERVVSTKGINEAYPTTRTPSGLQISLGNIAYGQPRHIIVQFSSLPDNYSDILEPQNVTFFDLSTLTRVCSTRVVVDEGLDFELESQELRLTTVTLISHLLKKVAANDRNDAEQSLKRLLKVISNSTVATTPYIKDLTKDITGQVTEAIAHAAFTRWGRHFLPSLMQAHAYQICNNFKDPGVQHYGGPLFEKLRDIADAVFVKLPAPVGTYKPPTAARGYTGGVGSSVGGGRSAASYTPKPVAATKFYNCSGGCIAGDSLVSTPSGTVKACELVRGSTVTTPSGPATVLCVVRLQPEGGKISFVKFQSGLRITPFHPVLTADGWKFPSDCDNTVEVMSREQFVFDFVLSSGHVVVADSVPIVTLGHGLEDKVVRHDFFGTTAVVSALQSHPDWETGTVTLKPENYKRGADSMICDLVF